MLFQWLVGIIAILALVAVVMSDVLTGKKKHSYYFQKVQKPVGKEDRDVSVTTSSKHDSFYSKLNAQ